MASVIDFVAAGVVESLEPGTVLPVDRHRSTERGLWPLGAGGSLYLLAKGGDDALWLVAILEAPEQSQIKPGDRRARGWYAPANVTPITKISGRLPTGRMPRKLAPREEQMLRELIDETDAPVIEAGTRESSPTIDADRPPLERAAACFTARSLKAGIAALLDAWRASRALELADLIDRASRCLPAFDRPLFVDRFDEKTITETWTATLAADPVGAMPQLLRNLREGSRAGTAVDRWKQLASLSDDPRIARRIAEILPHAVTDIALSIVERSRDVASWSAIAKVAPEIELSLLRDDETHEETTLAASGKVAFARKLRTAKLTKQDRAQVDAIATALDRLEDGVRTERDLVDAIADDWKDDAPRSVYADWLIERGHPRGEYLSLVLKGEQRLSPAQRRRLAMLSDVPYMYGALDDLAVLQRRLRRERGIDRTLDVYWSTMPAMWRSAARSPLVRALEQIRLVGEPHQNRAEALATFIRAAPRLMTIQDIDDVRAKPLVSLLGGEWQHDSATKRLARKPVKSRRVSRSGTR